MSSRPAVLIVEDELIVAQNVERYLVRLGYLVIGICSSSFELHQILETERPDVVLMDIRLEGDTDGVALAEYLHGEKGIPVVFLTALMDEETLQRAKITQPFGYIVKPFSQRELHIALEIALYKARLEQRLQDQEVLLQTLIEGMNQGFCLVDSQGRVAYANKEMGRMLGFAAGSAAIGSDLDAYIWPSGLLRTKLLAEDSQSFEAQLVTDDQRLRLIVNTQPIPGKDAAVRGAFISLTVLSDAIRSAGS
jgi:PAS domain S-box-containing protein